jgi:hypothetical protein
MVPLLLLAAGPAFAEADCKTVAIDIRVRDQLAKQQGAELSARYGDIRAPDATVEVEVKRDFIDRLRAYIDTVNRDIADLSWLLDHHCGQTRDEPEAIASMRDMQAAAQQLTLILNGYLKRQGRR